MRQELERAKLHGQDTRTIDALKAAIERAEAAEADFIQVHKNCIAARDEVDRLRAGIRECHGMLMDSVRTHGTEGGWLDQEAGKLWALLTPNDPNSGAARGPIAGGPLE